MRREMREAKTAEMKERLSARNEYADQLVENWSKRKGIGDGMTEIRDLDENKARSLALILENQENHMTQLTETQISNSFSTTPENVLRVVRLGYPNSVRGELFYEWAMETARDSVYYLSAVYGKTKRGATAGNSMKESSAFRYPSEIEQDELGTGDGSTTEFTVTLEKKPVRPYTVKISVDDVPVATDDGSGNLIGSVLDTQSTNTVDYTSGEVVVNFSTAPTSGVDVLVESYIDTEVADLYSEIGSVELQLKDYQFRVKPFPLYVSWTKMTEFLLNSTLSIDAEESLLSGAGQELKKALDFQAIRLAFNSALGNTAVSFDTEGAVGEPEIDRAMAFNRAIDGASDKIFDALQRGGVSKMIGGPDAVSYLKLHRRFDSSNRQPRVGAYREGSLDGIDIYKVPSNIIPKDQFMTIWRNEDQMEDASVLLGSYIPLYKTQTLEYKEFYSETGMAFFGDSKVVQPKYLQRIKLDNLA